MRQELTVAFRAVPKRLLFRRSNEPKRERAQRVKLHICKSAGARPEIRDCCKNYQSVKDCLFASKTGNKQDRAADGGTAHVRPCRDFLLLAS